MNGNCSIHEEAYLQLSDKKLILCWFIIDLNHLFSIINANFSNHKHLILLKQLNEILFPYLILFLILQVVRMDSKGGDYWELFLICLLWNCRVFIEELKKRGVVSLSGWVWSAEFHIVWYCFVYYCLCLWAVVEEMVMGVKIHLLLILFHLL